VHPTLLHLGHLYLPTFGVVAALGLAAAISMSLRTARMAGVSPDELWDAGMFAVFAAFVTSRLLLVAMNFKSFTAAPVLLLTVPSLTAGGLVLTAAATVVYLHWKRMPLRRSLDAWAAPGTLLWAFLAMGHMAEGSDPGLPTRFGLRTSLAGYREQPVALYAAVAALGITVVLYGAMRERRPSEQVDGRVAGAGLVMVGVVQFGLSFLRIPYFYDRGAGFLMLLDPLQWVAVGMVAVGGVLVMWGGFEEEGISPLRPAAFGRDDGGKAAAFGRDDGGVKGGVMGRDNGFGHEQTNEKGS
jgi:phosphatidylglycerol:prolipoprotein diacylglycerol transferase